MLSEIPDRWIVLRVRIGPRAIPHVAYEDDRGTVHRLPPDVVTGPSGWRPVKLPLLAPDLPAEAWCREDLAAMVDRALAGLPPRREGPHGGLPVPLPIFLDSPPAATLAQWEDWLMALLEGAVSPDRLQTVRLAQARWAPRSPFRLPLRVLAVGADAESVLEPFRGT